MTSYYLSLKNARGNYDRETMITRIYLLYSTQRYGTISATIRTLPLIADKQINVCLLRVKIVAG